MKKTQLSCLSAAALLLVPFLAACEPTIATRGNLLDPDLLAQVKPGETTREEVATKLGTPTSISTFDDKIWYYAGRQTQQYSFFDPEVIKQQVVEIDFNDEGTVTAAKKLDLSKSADITPVDRVTPSYGQENTLLHELLGDLSHPVPDLKNQTHGQ